MKDELMKKWIPTIVTLVVTLVGVLTPQIQEALKNHPEAGIIIAGIYAVVKGFAPSPVAENKPNN